LIERLTPVTKDRDETLVQERVLKKLDARLDTRVLPGTNVIEVSVLHPNPEMAARLVNATIDSYREYKMDEKFQQTKQISGAKLQYPKHNRQNKFPLLYFPLQHLVFVNKRNNFYNRALKPWVM
jgi:hypothetical protein